MRIFNIDFIKVQQFYMIFFLSRKLFLAHLLAVTHLFDALFKVSWHTNQALWCVNFQQKQQQHQQHHHHHHQFRRREDEKKTKEMWTLICWLF